MTETPKDALRRCPRWMPVVLVVSVSLNLLVAGLMLGQSLRAGEAEGVQRSRFTDRIVSMLPEERRDYAREVLDGDGGARRAEWEARAEAHRAIIAAMRAEPFDPQRLTDALEARRGQMAERFKDRGARMVALVTEISAQERAALADGLEDWAENAQARRRGEPG